MPPTPAPAPPVPFEQIADGLMGAVGWIEKVFEVACRRADIGPCSPREFILLRMICRYAFIMQAPPGSDVAKALGVSKSYVTRLSRTLLREGLVAERRNAGDDRVRALDATKEGERLGDAEKLGEEAWELLVAELGLPAATSLARVLVRLQRHPRELRLL